MNEQRPVRQTAEDGTEPTLGAKVAFLGRPGTYGAAVADVVRRETHMSWVFLAGEHAYKLKKPVHFPYLDFSTMARREQVCRAELRLNRRLAPDVYLDVVPLTDGAQGLRLGGDGVPVDWLVHMRRLDESHMLDRLIIDGQVQTSDIDRLVDVLADFYRAAAPTFMAPPVYLAELRRALDYNRRILLDARFGLPTGLVYRVDRVQRRFLEQCGHLIATRLRHRRLVEGHGDLRPEHVSLGDKVRIIDCLEFNARLRVVDPFDEIAYLGLECERLGAAWIGRHLRRRMKHLLRDGPADGLFAYYYCYRATLRARLSIAHLLEAKPRNPEKWAPLAREYLGLAARGASVLERWLRTRSDR